MNLNFIIIVICFMKTLALDSEEEAYATYNSYAPSTSNFQDMYTSTFNRNDESTLTEDEYTVNGLHTAEFHPKVLKISLITASPKILLSSSYKKRKQETSSSTEDPEPIKVIPIRNKQKGVLDVLFPPTRVKSFKNVFDSFRRILSYTFRK